MTTRIKIVHSSSMATNKLGVNVPRCYLGTQKWELFGKVKPRLIMVSEREKVTCTSCLRAIGDLKRLSY